jgi:hypothetical protein
LIRILGSVVLDRRAHVSGEEEHRLLTVGNGGRSVEVEVHITPGALATLAGRDVHAWLEERVAAFTEDDPDDGRKLERLESNSPLTFDAA